MCWDRSVKHVPGYDTNLPNHFADFLSLVIKRAARGLGARLALGLAPSAPAGAASTARKPMPNTTA